jgi:MFS family permease
VLAAYYYGYVATQLMGGRLSETMGAKMVYGTGIMLSGVLTLMGPVAVRAKFYAFIAIRVLTGAASVWPNVQKVDMSRNKKGEWKNIGQNQSVVGLSLLLCSSTALVVNSLLQGLAVSTWIPVSLPALFCFCSSENHSK